MYPVVTVSERRAGSRYYLSFGFTALILVSVTLVLVLIVLPQRYVLSAGLRESGVNFPVTAVPFAPFEITQQAARPVPEPAEILPGPAEVFWAELMPLLEAEVYDEAIPLFEPYLSEYPNDLGVLREYATTLLAAGRVEEAVPILASLLETGDETALRLLLARSLRDEGRMDEASTHYALLTDVSPEDVELALEWAQALAWARQYERATVVLDGALRRNPNSIPLRLELVRVHYSSGRLSHAALIMATLDPAVLENDDAAGLRADVLAALAVPVEPPPPEPTLLDQAVAARLAGEFDRSDLLYQAALREDPEDVGAWQAHADFLQFELGDFERALTALAEVERRSDEDARLQYRMAQLEIWTGRNAEAETRLEGMLAYLDEGPVAADPKDPTSPPDGEGITRADVQALRGDLERWKGGRIPAATWYELALADEPDNPRALEGLGVLRGEVAQTISEVERPGAGVEAYSIADSDDFSRVDLGAAWVGTRGTSVWAVRTGNRWLTGLDLNTAPGDQQGFYGEFDAARWWRWGTVRTAFHFGVQAVRAGGEDYSLGASVRFRGAAGRSVELRYDHEPAYSLTGTLQSVFAQLSQDRLSLTLARPLNDRWSLFAEGHVALLDPQGLSGPDADRTSVRVQASVSAGRSMTQSVTAGVSARAVAFTDAAPVQLGVPLFWDPRSVLSGGPYLQLGHRVSSALRATGRLTPGLAVIDERRRDGVDIVPHFSAEAGLEHTGDRFRTALDLFYYQGQFDGYRMYGLRLSLRTIDGFGGGGP